MPVRVPFHLIRRSQAEAAAAVLLLSTDVGELLALCGRLGVDPLPPIFPVEDGFLVVPESLPPALPARTIRLRRLSENCYVPADADLVPALHRDEASDLTRQRGLLFLPGDRCLAFRPDAPLAAVGLLEVPKPKREAWQPFPEAPELPDRLSVITRLVPDIRPDDILNAGGAGIGEEAPPRPPRSNPLKTVIGKVTMGFGKGLAALGAAFGMGGLARLGQNLIGRAISAVPRLSEALLGKQEAALRELLRKFREGRTDEALKNALPMGGKAPAGSIHASDQLPTHDIKYSLAGLFGSGEAATVWIGGADLQRELMNEYRKAAQEALAQGDYRRAAFIYGKLLGELHTAADILAKGGLHRDAAILFRDLLYEPRWAAREFEAAGEWDEALRLYRQVGEHEAAGDLLRRIGDEEGAIEEYHRAAAKIIEERRDYLKAGELMLRKTGRADLAGAYFAIGWRERGRSLPHVNNALPCAVRLSEILAFGETLGPFWTLLDEVEIWLEGPGNSSDTAGFFNAILKLAELPHLARHRGDLRDRAKLALAGKLRQHQLYESRPGNLVSDLFGNSAHWPLAVVSDANYALRSAMKKFSPGEAGDRPFNSLRLGQSAVTAAAFAPDTEDIVVGFDNGKVVSFRPETSRISVLASPTGEAIEAIAVDERGRTVVTAGKHEAEANVLRLRGYRRNESDEIKYESKRVYELTEPGWYLLNPFIHDTTLLSTSVGIVELKGTVLLPYGPKHGPKQASGIDACPCYLILPAPKARHRTSRVIAATRPVIDSSASFPIDEARLPSRIVVEDRAVIWSGTTIPIGWRPVASSFAHPSLSWLQTAVNRLEIAGISDENVICWSEVIAPDDEDATDSRNFSSTRPEGYGAVVIWKPGMVIGVTLANRVCWLRAGSVGFQEWAPAISVPIPSKPVACFPSHATGEVVVILADGEVTRIPVPL